MEKKITLLLIVFFIIVGIVKQIISYINLKKKLNFTEDYREKLISLVKTLASTKKLDNAINKLQGLIDEKNQQIDYYINNGQKKR